MENPYKKPKKPFGAKVNEQVEKIVYQVMTNEGLEQTVNRAIQKAVLTLVYRYWLLAVLGVITLSLFQAVLFSLAFRWVSLNLK